MRARTVVATLIALCLSLIAVTSVALSRPGAPTITSLTADLTTLTVVWSAPSEDGGSTITSYDLRYIRSDAAGNGTDSDWTVIDDAWTSGALTYQLTTLRRDTSYDVALRAENTDGESEWSATSTTSTTDHGDSTADATTLEVGSTIEGSIDPKSDADYFRIVVSSRTDLWVYASGALDTTGYLLNSNGTLLTKNQDSAYVDFPRAFSIRREVNSGTYYIKVESRGQLLTGTYAIHVQAARNPGSTPRSAERVELNSMTPGRLSFPGGDRGALDYFSFHLDSSTDVWALGVGNVDTVAELRNSRGAFITGNDDSLWPKNALSFLLRARLGPGTYYLKVEGYVRKDTGPYTLELREAIVASGSQTEPTPMSLDTPQTGYLSSTTDTDHFQFSIKDDIYVVIQVLSYGRHLPVTISGTGITSLVDAYSKPRSSLGKLSYWTWGKLAAGDYNIAVSPAGSDAGWYMIFITTDRYGEVLDTCQAITTSVNDPLYGCQWHLKNTGQFPNGAMQDIGVEDVWDDTDPTTMGEGINVAVVDDGMDTDHADLSLNVTATRNYNYRTGTQAISDPNERHGTAVAGIIAARDNSVGVRGVAPRATIYGYNLLGYGVSTSANVADAMTRNMADTAVYNNSWGYSPFGQGNPAYAEGAWERAVVNGVTNGYVINGLPKGVSYIFAAGNGHSYGALSNINGYRNHYAVTTVCAVNYNDKRSSYSEQGANLWVCGPSSDRGAIHDLASITTLRNNDRYRDDFGGTSAATPIVSGVVALIRAANQELTWRDVKLILAESARKNDPANRGWRTGAERYGSEGNYEFNYQYGFGMVNAKAAVDLAESWANLPPMRARKAYSPDDAQPIPAASYSYVPGATIESTLTMDDYVDFIEFVQINVDFQQRFFRNIDIELIAPSGKSSMLTTAGFVKYAVSFNGNFRFGSALHLGEDAAGVWKLRVTNRLGQVAGTLRGWSVTVYGHGLTPGLLTVSAATPGAGSLDVAWTAPAAVDGETLSAVTSYDLRYTHADATDKSESRWTTVNSLSASGTLQHKLDNLDALTEYQIQVRAHNDASPGPWSAVFKATTFDDPPSVPRNISIVPGNAALATSWQEPSSSGGTATSYDVRHIESDATDKDDPNSWTDHIDAWEDGDGDLLFSIPNLINDEQYDVQVRGVNDGGTGDWSSTTTGTLVLRNSQPKFPSSGDYTRYVDENSPAGTDIGDPVVANDEDLDTLTYSLGSGTVFFDIIATTGQLLTRSALNHEGISSYTITVQVSDLKNVTFEADTVIDDTITVTVEVNNVDEPPATSGPQTRSFQENSDSLVAVYTATDPDGETVSGWDLEGVDRDKFEISNGALSFTEPPNFEARADFDGNNDYDVTLVARAGLLEGKYDVTVTVTNVNEAPTAVNDTATTDEDQSVRIDVLDNDTDPDTERANLRVSVRTQPLNGRARVESDRTITYTPNANFAGENSFTYGLSDGSLSDDGSVTVTVEAVNDAPVFPPSETGARSVSESAQPGDEVGTKVEATDVDDITLTYTLSGASEFVIDATGQISVALGVTLDREDTPSYTVTVTATDDVGESDSISVTINVSNVNEAPTAVDDTATTDEDQSVRIDVLDNDTDPDTERANLRVSVLTQPLNGRARVESDRTITYTPNANFAGENSFTYGLSDGSLSDDGSVTVTVNPVNDAPEFATEMTTRTVSEGAQPGDEVGTKVEATDVDDITLTYSLSGASDFVIDATGQISVAPGVTLDREDTPSYTATVTATDDVGASDSITVTINVSNVNEAPTAVNDTATTDEDQSVRIDVLDNDSDPEDERSELLPTVFNSGPNAPRHGTVSVNEPAHAGEDRTITYEPNENYHGADSFTYRVSDTGSPSLSSTASVSVTIYPVNDAPRFRESMPTRLVAESAEHPDKVGALVEATDVDNAMLTYRLLPGVDAFSFEINSNGQITVGMGVTFDAATKDEYAVTVTADDGSGEANATATVEVTITVTAGPVLPPVIIITGGGGGGGDGPSGPTPSEADFEWTVERDIEELGGGHDKPSGTWSDGATLWVLENGDGADDAIYAYDVETGERVEGREFKLDETNRAPRGVWSDRTVLWVSDSGRNRLFAHDLATGERLPERDLAFAERNRTARGIWSDEETMFVLDGGKDSLFAYDLASGELLAEFALDPANDDPHGIWSDRVTIWVSNDDPKRLFAYRLPAPEGPAAEDAEPQDLERVSDEEFEDLSDASNNSPRGIWSDGDVMYVADESDDKVYTYNMPDAINARLASLTLSGVDIGVFDPGAVDYEGSVAEGVTETTVEAVPAQSGASVAIDPPDADGEADGHQVALEGPTEITVTVTSPDGSRTKVYRVAFVPPVMELVLSPTWTSFGWPGDDGTAVVDALRDGGISDRVLVIYGWDEATGVWLTFFPGLEDVPGLNTLTTLQQGSTYWVAVSEPLTWTLETGAPAER